MGRAWHGGCPLGTAPAHLEDNRKCVLAHLAPRLPASLRATELRPPAADLQREMVPTGGGSRLDPGAAGGRSA